MPSPLRPGDKIAILSPASIIDPSLVEGAVATLESMGYRPVVMPHALGSNGSYSGTVAERLADMQRALSDPDVKAIICSRGGYGAVHLLADVDRMLDSCEPKWLVGFSDISALHALWRKHGIPSVHASMCKQLALGPDTEATRRLFAILTGNPMPLTLGSDITLPSTYFASNSYSATLYFNSSISSASNICSFTGTLSGGNLAVIEGLAGTPYDAVRPGDILVIEDIAEPIYKVERIMYRLRLAGILDRLSALIVGRFTEYKPDRNYPTMEAMLADILPPSLPVVYDAPVGHIGPDNMPLLLGAPATISM